MPYNIECTPYMLKSCIGNFMLFWLFIFLLNIHHALSFGSILFLSCTELVIKQCSAVLYIFPLHGTVDERYFYKILNVCLLRYILGICIASVHTVLN